MIAIIYLVAVYWQDIEHLCVAVVADMVVEMQRDPQKDCSHLCYR
jgi:hypothetical protein